MLTRRKNIIIVIIVVTIISSLLFMFFNLEVSNSQNYKINLSKIDEYSPDRKLEVLKDNKVIEFDRIYYDLENSDEVILCYGENPYVSYLDFNKVTKLIIVLKDSKKIHIEYIMEE